MAGYLEINVKKMPGGDSGGLYRMKAETLDAEYIAMAEFVAGVGGGWCLTGHVSAGPYKTLREARAVFTAFVRAGGGRRGQHAIRALDRRAELPLAVSPDPMLTMCPGYDGPLDVDEIRAEAYIDPWGARALIDQHRQRMALYGEDPAWAGDRRRLLDQGYGPLIAQTRHERDEITPYIRA